MVSTCTIDERTRMEHLVDRVLGIVFPGAIPLHRRTLIRLIHHAREARRAGQLDDALATLRPVVSLPNLSVNTASAPRDLACWAYNEWISAVRQLYPARETLLYRAATGQAAIVQPVESSNTVSVLTVLGLSWEPGKVLSRRCLRGLRALHPSGESAGGAPCQ